MPGSQNSFFPVDDADTANICVDVEQRRENLEIMLADDENRVVS